MTKTASLYEAPRVHPFAGKLRPIAEIASICGLSTAAIDRYIQRGESIPMTLARSKWMRRHEAGMAQISRPVSGVGSPKKPIMIDGEVYYGIEATAKRFRTSIKTLQRLRDKHGDKLSADHLGRITRKTRKIK